MTKAQLLAVGSTAELGAAVEIRLQMAADGWHSDDKLTDMGWGGNGRMGYSIWFWRYDWHGEKALRLTGSKACYHAHTPDLGKIADATRRAAELARRAWQEFPGVPPRQGGDCDLEPGSLLAPNND